METDILLDSIQVKKNECLICYEVKDAGFFCEYCAWEHCDDCHALWLKQSQTCPQCRAELDVELGEEEDDEDDYRCTHAFVIVLLHVFFFLLLFYVVFVLLVTEQVSLDCDDDVMCLLNTLVLFLLLVSCAVHTIAKVASYRR